MYSNVNAPPVLGANVAPQPSCYMAPAFGYAAPVNRCDDFVLIVVLFILLIIVGATIYCSC
jgi:uncharacterized protein (TIGR01732 family)